MEVNADIQVGAIVPALSSERIALRESVSAEETEAASLERPIDPAGVTEAPVKERRYYTPRGSTPLSMRGS